MNKSTIIYSKKILKYTTIYRKNVLIKIILVPKKIGEKSPISSKQTKMTYSQINLNQNISNISNVNSPIISTARITPSNSDLQNNPYMTETNHQSQKIKSNKQLTNNYNFQNIY